MNLARASWILLLCCGSAAAHHGNSEFDLTVTVRYEGTILETQWINPHTVTTLETRTATGEPITLEIEGSSPAILRTGGFSAASLPKGEHVTAVVSPSRRFPKESAYGYEIIKGDGTVIPLVSARMRKATITPDWLGAQRTVYTDGRAHPSAQERFPQGHSTGRFEGEVLVVDTTNFTDQEAQGVPSGAGKHLVERFTLAADGKSLSYEFVWSDPQYLAAELKGTAELGYRPDLAPEGIACNRESAERFFREFQ